MYYRKRFEKRKIKKLVDGPGKKYCCGAYYDEKKKRYYRYYVGCKSLKKALNKKVRHCLKNNEELTLHGNQHKKMFEYWWTIF